MNSGSDNRPKDNRVIPDPIEKRMKYYYVSKRKESRMRTSLSSSWKPADDNELISRIFHLLKRELWFMITSGC